MESYFVTGVSVFAIIGSIISIVVSIRQEQRVKFNVIQEYYLNADTSEMISARAEYYKCKETGPFDKDKCPSFGLIVTKYDLWGMLCLNNYLPIWMFEGALGAFVVESFDYVKDYIYERRNNNINKRYAWHYEKLAQKITKKYGIYPG